MNKASFLKTLFLTYILLISANSFSATSENNPGCFEYGEEVSSNEYISHHLVFNKGAVFPGEENPPRRMSINVGYGDGGHTSWIA